MMDECHAHLRQLGKVLCSAYRAYFEAHCIMVDSLPRNHRQALQYCGRAPEATSVDVAIEFNWQQNYASDVLKELTEFGLLSRTEVVDERGKYFIYSIQNMGVPL